ncbi:MAG: ABC transporter permease [Acidimicrobiia bacterium]|nr:MAG: ABC transporter permease [Acidimicrobiia bacterium]
MIEFIADVARWFVDNWDGSTGYLVRTWEHIVVSGTALLAAAAVSLPLGAWLGHTGRGGTLAVSLVNVGRALPSFGIIALALPFTIRLADAVPFIDSGLGFLPTFVALFALALPPIFTNTHAGIRSIEPETVDAARGMGMSERQILLEVELPIASPVVLAGLRVTAVQVVATAPLGALVAYGGLGRFIIDGFAVRDGVQIFSGAVLVALLSVLTEGAFVLLERRLTPQGVKPTSRAEASPALPH